MNLIKMKSQLKKVMYINILKIRILEIALSINLVLICFLASINNFNNIYETYLSLFYLFNIIYSAKIYYFAI